MQNIIHEAKKYVNMLLSPLNNLYYHSYWHAIDVMQRAIYLAEQEWLTTEEIEMLALAWLFHDTWFTVIYDKNEPIWANIAKNYLRSIKYDRKKIKIIEEIILATDPDYKEPKNIYEKIIKDADMDNLWRDDFEKKSNDIKKEIETIKRIQLKDPEWKHSLVDLLLSHKFNTDSQRNERYDKKQENLLKIVEDLRREYCEDEKVSCNFNQYYSKLLKQ